MHKRWTQIRVVSWVGLACLCLSVVSAGAELSRSGAGTTNDSAAVSPDPAQRRFVAAYDTMTMADWLKSQGMLDEAIDLYGESIVAFRTIAREQPDWKPAIIAFRIRYCEEELGKLKIAATHGIPLNQPVTLSATNRQPVPTPVLALSLSPVPVPSRPVVMFPPTPVPKKDAREGKSPPMGPEPKGPTVIQTALQKERAGELKDALDIYAAILTEQPAQVQALRGVARCYLRLDAFAQAKTALLKQPGAVSSDPELNLLLAIISCQEKDYIRALQLAHRVLAEAPLNPLANLTQGVALWGVGKSDDAIVATQKAISLDSRLADGYYNLAWMLLKKNPPGKAEALSAYQSALKHGADPDPALARLLQ